MQFLESTRQETMLLSDLSNDNLRPHGHFGSTTKREGFWELFKRCTTFSAAGALFVKLVQEVDSDREQLGELHQGVRSLLIMIECTKATLSRK